MSPSLRFIVGPSVAGLLLAAIPANGDEVVLAGGDTLSGKVVQHTADAVVLDHAVLGRMTIPAIEIQSIVDSADRTGPYAELQEEAAEAVAEAEMPKEWKSRFELALGGSFGNTDSQAFRTGVVSKRESESDRTALDASYFYGASDGDRTDNRFTAGILHDWLFPESPWFLFADGRYDYDEFKSWEHRISAHIGPGYELIKKEDFTLNLRAGIGVVKEFGSDNDDFRPEAMFGGDFAWQISERQSLEGSTMIYPDLDDTGEFRTFSRLNWAMLVDPDSNMSLTAGLEHEYQSKVDPGVDENDLRIFAGLMFDF
ncbi:MAG: DUF481 domain-containing protein [Phycisphaerales bacterium]|nr:MAG: DUF481 domain-containing protein [Phycisphaerales bacterium]